MRPDPTTSPQTLPPGYSLRRFHGRAEPELLRQSAELRLVVWQAERTTITGDYSNGRMDDACDPDSWHLGILGPAGVMVGSARIHIYLGPEELAERPWLPEVEHKLVFPVAYGCRQVVLRSHRGRGLGRYLDREATAMSRELGAGCILLDITPNRVEHYEQMGFEVLRRAEPGVVFPDEHWVHIIQYL